MKNIVHRTVVLQFQARDAAGRVYLVYLHQDVEQVRDERGLRTVPAGPAYLRTLDEREVVRVGPKKYTLQAEGGPVELTSDDPQAP